jgi:hypothetical protein
MKNFNIFLLQESQNPVSVRIGDIFSALEDLSEESANLTRRPLERAVKKITDNIRTLLHGAFSDKDVEVLKVFQKIGVALLAELEKTESNFPGLLASAVEDAKIAIGKMEQPLNEV